MATPPSPIIYGSLADSQAYERYAHAVRIAYRSLGLVERVSPETLHVTPFSEFVGLPLQERFAIAVRAMKQRLSQVSLALGDQIFDEPWLRKVSFMGRDAFIPIINEEGRGWYAESPMMNFDFFAEAFCGMHQDAKVIYDIGGHQGVWATYYAITVGPNGRVYTFEPSILNVETAALSFLINDLANGIIIPFGIGESNESIRPDEKGLLIAGVSHNVNIVRLDNTFWEKPDFMKIDIEGFEHELVKSLPDLFEFCCNMHLEVHVPHLVNRGIDYREIFDLIPFDRVRVQRSEWGNMTEIGPDSVLEGYCSLLITPK